MPRQEHINTDGTFQYTYINLYAQYADVPNNIDWFKGMRRSIQHDADAMILLNKQVKDKTIAGSIKMFQRQYKAANIIINNWYGMDLTNHIPIRLYPIELTEEFDWLFGVIETNAISELNGMSYNTWRLMTSPIDLLLTA